VQPGEPGGEPGGQPPALSADERTELARLRTENSAYATTLSSLDPIAEDLARLRDDEEYRNFTRENAKFYEDLKHKAPAGYTPEMQRLRDEILGEIKPVTQLVTDHTAAQKQERENRKTRAFNEGKPIVEAYLTQHPELKTSGTFGKTLAMLQEEAVDSDKPFKEVWDNYVSAWGGTATRQPTPPRQLRSNDAEPGIPAATDRAGKPPAAGERPKTIREAFLETHARLNGQRAS
jgi:hypothetical protein